MAYTANTTLNKKHVVVLDYLKAGTGSGSIVFYSSWSNPDDIPEGTSALSQSLSSTSRAVTEYLYNGSVSHIRISGEPNSQVTAYSAVYAVGKYVNPEPSHSTWGNEESSGGGTIPDQSSFLRFKRADGVYALCVVPNGQGAASMGGIPKVRKDGVTYDIYLVETNDAFASPVRVKTSAGTKAVRYYTSSQ